MVIRWRVAWLTPLITASLTTWDGSSITTTPVRKETSRLCSQRSTGRKCCWTELNGRWIELTAWRGGNDGINMLTSFIALLKFSFDHFYCLASIYFILKTYSSLFRDLRKSVASIFLYFFRFLSRATRPISHRVGPSVRRSHSTFFSFLSCLKVQFNPAIPDQ